MHFAESVNSLYSDPSDKNQLSSHSSQRQQSSRTWSVDVSPDHEERAHDGQLLFAGWQSHGRVQRYAAVSSRGVDAGTVLENRSHEARSLEHAVK